jgi:hypothetical protein
MMSQVVELLPSKCQALSQSLVLGGKKEEEEEENADIMDN